jgi:hypothetical protein
MDPYVCFVTVTQGLHQWINSIISLWKLTENSLMDYKGMLDDYDSHARQDCSFLNSIHHLCWKGKPTTYKVAAYSDSEDSVIGSLQEKVSYESNGSEDDNNQSSTEEAETAEGLGDKIIAAWHKRKEKLSHDYAIAAWILSPCPLIMSQVHRKLSKQHNDAVNHLIKKLLVDGTCPASDVAKKFLRVSEMFWKECQEFAAKRGNVFASDNMLWQSPTIDSNQTWRWHFMYTSRETQCLGQLACLVTPKTTGSVCAERNWGDVKHLKSGKRLDLSSKGLNKQTTLYGASCVERAVQRQKTDKRFTKWDDVDMASLGLLDVFGQDKDRLAPADPVARLPVVKQEQLVPRTQRHSQKRIFNCFWEDWNMMLPEKNVLPARPSC